MALFDKLCKYCTFDEILTACQIILILDWELFNNVNGLHDYYCCSDMPKLILDGLISRYCKQRLTDTLFCSEFLHLADVVQCVYVANGMF